MSEAVIDPEWLSGEIAKLAAALVFRYVCAAHSHGVPEFKAALTSLREPVTALDCLCDAVGRKLGRPFLAKVAVPGLPEILLGEQWDKDDEKESDE